MFGNKNKGLKEEDILNALRKVEDPDLHIDIVTLNMVSDIKINLPKVFFKLTLTTPACPLKEKIEHDCREALLKLDGVEEVEMESTASVASGRKVQGREPVEGIKQIIAITSGKGGVGKSTVTLNLAAALTHLGAKVGILDADITAPNIPAMMGLDGYEPQGRNNRIMPAEKHGIKCISMAFFVSKDTPIIWRGPMLDKAIRQFLRDVEWGELDYLLVDLPPGTGDAQLSISQATNLTGGVIVTTPQDIALLDGRKGLAMFQQMQIPVLGFVENMSYFHCPHCEGRTDIFNHGGGKALAEEVGVPFLGEVPLDIAVREGGDNGMPITSLDINHPVSQAFLNVAKQMAAQVSIASLKSPVAAGNS
ncbi:MAG: Mrp/NBP35 family ATP-binding protein [Candidatus Obscuribacterales bacterium]|nr:Mrp/NBP35 family ATP-binding protein [Candidatus Obscuribacterales bacterium]